MAKYIVMIKDPETGKFYYLNPIGDYLAILTEDLGEAPKFSCEELAVSAYKLFKNRIPKSYKAGVYVLEGDVWVCTNTLKGV